MWKRVQESTGISFTKSLMDKRDFHNPNMAEFLGRLGGLDEFETNLDTYNDIIKGIDVPNFELMGVKQRSEWEKKQNQAGQAARQPISFVSSSQKNAPSSYAALLQERRNQQRQ